MKNFNYQREIIFWLLLVIPFLVIAYVWDSLPQTIPVHFNIHGAADRWGGKWSIFMLPVISIGTYLLMVFLPLIDPKRMDTADFSSMFYKIRSIFVIFFSAVSLFIIYITINGGIDRGAAHWIPVAIFLFLSVLGNFMINIKPNWFMGIRTPWTLSSDNVWRKTHQLMGRVWFYGGLVCAALSFFAPDRIADPLILVFVFGGVVLAFGYSFWLFRKEKSGTLSDHA